MDDNAFVFDFGCRFVVVFKVVEAKGAMASSKGLDVVLEGALVFEVGATETVPNLPAVLLVGSPVAFHSKGFAAFSAGEGLDAVLSLVMCLEGAEVLERPRPRVIDVVLAAWGAAVARQPQHCRWLSPF